MEPVDLLNTFHAHLDSYRNFRSFIDKAREQSGKFSSATIARVIEKNEAKSVEEADAIRPLVPELEDHLLTLSTEIDQIKDRKAGADLEMEELELRRVIGEISDEDFEAASSNSREQLATAEARINTLSEELKRFQDALDSWVELAVAAGHPTGLTQESAPAPEVQQVEESAHQTSAAPAQVDAPAQEEDPVLEDEGWGNVDVEDDALPESSPTLTGIVDDVSALFDEPAQDAAAEEDDSGEEELSIEVAEAATGEPGVNEGDGLEIGFDNEEVDLLGDDNDVELDLVPGGEQSAEEDLGFDDEQPAEQPAAAASSGARRAFLIYQEGTAEEQIYPFSSDQITIGRGRDNDIQIKNDSKVSRYHCVLTARGGNFYIEDKKSSNGSLVNGELITERRLFGGEEVIIGETFFRFRIME